MTSLQPQEGWIDAGVASEFPDLRLWQLTLPLRAPIGKSGEGMRERLRVYGGDLEVEALPGGGQRVSARLPVETSR